MKLSCKLFEGTMTGVKSVKKGTDEGKPAIIINFDHKGCNAFYTMQYKTIAARDKAFENLILEEEE